MAFPSNTALICQFLSGFDPKDFNFVVRDTAGVISIDKWDQVAIGRPEPTEQEVIDAGNDLTLVNGQTFSQWFDENGGDNTLTNRARAIKLLNTLATKEGAARVVLIRAVVLSLLDEINVLRDTLVLSQIGAGALKTSIETKINSGGAD